MRSANWIEETTTSIAGTSGDGAVTLTAVANTPRFSSAFGTQATTVRYVITKTSTGERESGIGSVSSNVLTRTRPQVTWTGSAWDESTPSPLAFGSTPTSGDVLVSIAPVSEGILFAAPGVNQSIGGDATWRDYPISRHTTWNGSGGGSTLTADREYYTPYLLMNAGSLDGAQFEVTSAVGSSNVKWGLFACGHNGLPGAKIVDFVTTATASTGVKTDTATGSWSPAGAVWLPAGWYFIGMIPSHAIGIRGGGNGWGTSGGPLGRAGAYGWGPHVYVAGNYATGLPATPNLTGGALGDPGANNPSHWIGLKVTS